MRVGGRNLRIGAIRAAAVFCGLSLAACGLPREGPSYSDLTAEPVEGGPDFEIINVTPDVVAMTSIDERAGFAVSFVDQPVLRTATIAVGDILSITVWENTVEGLLNPAGVGATPLPNAVVDEGGHIFVPYVGRVRAAGRTLNQLRSAIRAELDRRTPNVQVDILPVEAGGRLVSIQGMVNTPGLYPIERQTTRLLAMLAQAGGVSEDPQTIRVRLRRGSLTGEISLADLYDDPTNDVPLRSGDALILERDRRVFTALGAVGGQQLIPFPRRDLSLMEALGLVGGLEDATSDPKGIFVFRVEPMEIARRLLPGQEIFGPVQVAYIFDWTEPGATFLGRNFALRDGDTLFVTQAPYVYWQKILQGITPLVGFGGSARSLSGI